MIYRWATECKIIAVEKIEKDEKVTMGKIIIQNQVDNREILEVFELGKIWAFNYEVMKSYCKDNGIKLAMYKSNQAYYVGNYQKHAREQLDYKELNLEVRMARGDMTKQQEEEEYTNMGLFKRQISDNSQLQKVEEWLTKIKQEGDNSSTDDENKWEFWYWSKSTGVCWRKENKISIIKENKNRKF